MKPLLRYTDPHTLVMMKERALLLDIFRIILCIGVVVYHFVWPRPSSGPYMVNGFFVMSGFLIGIMFRKTEVLDVTSFYANKVRRLLPLFLVALLLGIIYHVCTGEMLPEWTPDTWGSFRVSSLLSFYNTPLWYMAVECTLLFIVPFFFFLHRFKYGIPCIALSLMLITAVLFSMIPDASPFGKGMYYSPLARSWQFTLGIASVSLYVFIVEKNVHRSVFFRVSTVALFVVFAIVGGILMCVEQVEELNYWNYSFSFDFLTTCFYALLVPCLFAFTCKAGVKTSACVSYLALLTYPVFLFHVPVYKFTCDAIELYGYPEKWVYRVTAALVTVLFSALLMWAEKRLMSRKRTV